MIAIHDWFDYDFPPKERIKLIRQAGFDAVLLWWGDEFDNSSYLEYPDYARRLGLSIDSAHLPFDSCNDIWLDSLNGEGLTEMYAKRLEDAAICGVPALVMHLSRGSEPPPPNPLGLERMKRLTWLAEEKCVRIAVENLKKPEYPPYILDRIQSPGLGLCFDAGHQNCRTPEVDWLSLYGSRLAALHLHDNGGFISGAGEEDQHRLPFDGTVGWPATMRKIAGTGYKGAVALEVTNKGYEDKSAEKFLAIAFERAKRLESLTAAPHEG
ncbi:MAG: sugar phosphate isomerase/epimerase [Defluviitaleaceae bacterium]|nr:sugar phosphate isomerase/epimerase [Defluviitaleaceae bacterium]